MTARRPLAVVVRTLVDEAAADDWEPEVLAVWVAAAHVADATGEVTDAHPTPTLVRACGEALDAAHRLARLLGGGEDVRSAYDDLPSGIGVDLAALREQLVEGAEHDLTAVITQLSARTVAA